MAGSINITKETIKVTSDPNITTGKPGCLVLQYEGFLPWDDPDNVISAQTEDLVHRWKDTIFLPVLFLIGAPTNVINMAVFHKQGLKERINVCLFALSLADFLYLLQNFLLNCEKIQLNRKERYGPLSSFLINHNLIGFYGFTWVSWTISAIIASERCFCILRPLRSHTILRTSTTTAIIVAVNVVVVGLYFFVVSRYRVSCVYDPINDVSFVSFVSGPFYLRYRKVIDYLDAFVYGLILPGLMITVVAVCTTITTSRLRKAVSWRVETSSRGSMSSKEIALTKMLVCNSLLFMVCVFATPLHRVVWLFLPEMDIGGKQHNLFLLAIWLMDILSWTNSSFNFLIYFFMGSRYRATLRQLLGCQKKTAPDKVMKTNVIDSGHSSY